MKGEGENIGPAREHNWHLDFTPQMDTKKPSYRCGQTRGGEFFGSEFKPHCNTGSLTDGKYGRYVEARLWMTHYITEQEFYRFAKPLFTQSKTREIIA